MREQALLSGKQNPFMWESEELECVESWLGVLMCRTGDDAPGRDARSPAAQKLAAQGTRRRSSGGARSR